MCFSERKSIPAVAIGRQKPFLNNIDLTWELFAKFMKDTGVIAPERQAKRQYDRLLQSGNVFKYVSETKRLVQLMQPMPMICPGEADIIHNFITKAKPPLQERLREYCPVNYWTSSAEVFEKAIQFGTNHDPTLSRALGGPKLLGAKNGRPQSSHQPSNRDRNRRFNHQRRGTNRTYQPSRRSHTG